MLKKPFVRAGLTFLPFTQLVPMNRNCVDQNAKYSYAAYLHGVVPCAKTCWGNGTFTVVTSHVWNMLSALLHFVLIICTLDTTLLMACSLEDAVH